MRMNKIVLVISLLVVMAGCGKSKIEPSCSMNGFGSGSCVFTNTGDGAGAVCGKVRVKYQYGDDKFTESKVLCSGDVKPSSSTEVQFFVPNMEDVCYTNISGSWTERCNLYWIEN